MLTEPLTERKCASLLVVYDLPSTRQTVCFEALTVKRGIRGGVGLPAKQPTPVPSTVKPSIPYRGDGTLTVTGWCAL